jgi:hypothetical protein
MYRTLADSIQDLYEVTVSPSGLLVTDSMVRAVDKARKDRDPKGIGDAMSQLFNSVAAKAAGFQLKNFTRDEIGKRIGWLMDADITKDSTIRQFLAKYQRDLAMPAMETGIRLGAAQGLVKEVVRTPEGAETCQWCLDRCGVWDPYDANAYGVWARHGASAHGGSGGCDCDIRIRWRMDNDSEADSEINGGSTAYQAEA